MATQIDIATVNNLFPKILGKTVRERVFQSRYLKEINAAAEQVAYLNPAGLNSQFVANENATLFSVAEGGPILNGAPVEYLAGTVDIRKMWKSGGFTGDVQRQLDKNIAEIEVSKPDLRGNFDELNRIGHNRLVRDLIFSTLQLYAHHENYFALQGTDKSPIGVVTALPGTVGAGNVGFSWLSTPQGNRVFEKNQRIQFYDSASTNQRVGALASSAGSYFSTVNAKPDHRAATNSVNGTVPFDQIPSDLAVADTAHFQNTYGMLPTGFLHYVDDAGSYKGNVRATNPDLFASLVDRRTGSPNLTPLILFENESLLEGKVGYNMPFMTKIAMNKAQRFVYTSQLYNTDAGFAYTRFIDAGKNGGRIDKYDPSVNTKESALMFGDKEIIVDEHVPPSEVFFINFASWRKYVRTEVQAYQFDSGNYIINPIDAYGQRLDQRMFTIFSEYNWDCTNPLTNSRITGLGFNAAHVAQP
jgi:hypothetical protein